MEGKCVLYQFFAGGGSRAVVVRVRAVVIVVVVGVEIASRSVDVGLYGGQEDVGCIGSLNPRHERHCRGIVRAMTRLAQFMGV